jgi:hypothetical protein
MLWMYRYQNYISTYTQAVTSHKHFIGSQILAILQASYCVYLQGFGTFGILRVAGYFPSR